MAGGEEMAVRLLSWLERCGALSSIREQRAREKVVYRLCLELDPLELLQFSAELGNLLLHCPRQFWVLAQRVCWAASQDCLPGLSSPSQLLLELRLSSLPSLPGYTITRPSDFPPLSSEPRFFSISGVIVAATLPSQYTQSACYHCPVEGCAGGSSHYIRLHVAGSSESSTVRSDVSCHICGSVLTEDVSLRTLASKMIAQLVPSQSLRNSSASLTTAPSRQQATPIIFRGELCEGVRVGGEYCVIGVPVYSLNETSSRAFVAPRLEANNVFHVRRAAVTVDQSLSLLPTPVTDVLSACSYSPWAFSATLAYSFGAGQSPPGVQHRLKLAMLLSLVSSFTDTPLHLLAIATDTTPLTTLLLHGSSLAQRSTLFTSTSDLCGTTRREGADVMVEGGSLVLASGGVCVVGDVGRLWREKLDLLQHTLESSRVRLTAGGGVRGQHVEVWPLSCAVWAASQAPSKALADCMGLAVFCDPPTLAGVDFLSDLTAQHMLEQAMGTSSPPPLSHSHLHQLLAVVAGLRVRLSPQCQKLLRSFYLASRRVRSSSLHSSDMPLNALDIMSGLAEAHARISLRAQATEQDGVIAILLYEESLVGRHGNSVLQIIPAPHFSDRNLSAYLGREFDQHMKTLQQHIVQFNKSHFSSSELPLLPEE